MLEIEKKINEYNSASFKGDIEYQIKNTPKEYLNKNSISSIREKFDNIYNNRKFPMGYSNIGELEVQKQGKCNSSSYYKVEYKVTTAQMTPYLDASALEFNYSKYGKENVSFNPNSKILHITKQDTKILIYDSDGEWKILNLDKKTLNQYFGNNFFNCIE
ncbi:hypothetical protein [Aequorivita sinensis]|uniref:hypothetical protein n=1 Tax=Aequorivita sinensis TaxID=1382458 RepID=UPI00130E07BD|nr:hypothetical protein [Aequorivita sinensis]